MSVSPQPASAINPPISTSAPFPSMTMTSPPPNGSVSSQSNAQLAQLLTASYRESDLLRKDLTTTRKRLEKAERLLASYSAIASSTGASPPNANNGNGTHSISEATQRAIAECETRADRAEHARDEADARRRVLSDAWEELNRYLHVVELRAADARAGFSRLVAEGGGHLVLAPVPLPGYHPQAVVQTPSAPSPAIMLVPPPSANHRSHHHSSSMNSSHGVNPLPPPPHPSSRVRPRSGSLDESSYQLVSGPPPAKRPRNERDYDKSQPRGRPLDLDVHHRSHLPSPHLALQPTLSVPRHSNAHQRSRSSSRSSRRSLSIDEMLLEASTDDPRPRGEPQSPRAVIAHHQHPNHAPTPNSQRSIVGHGTPGPLEQPGEQRMYQTHIFAPPVTGAPMKKGKLGSTAGIMANGSGALPAPPITTSTVPPPPTPTTAVHQSVTSLAPPAVPHPHTPYPPTNAQGQRICRQCGLAGRYKDGKCVEKWGPGPEGPGTVCDRCRKKMKRVERRGTIESQNQSQSHIGGQQHSQVAAGSLAHAHPMSAHGNRVARTDTMPVTVGIGSGATQLIGHATQMPSFISKDRRDRERMPTLSLAPSPSHPSRVGDSQREPPSPPAIATLQTDDDELHRRGSADRGRRPMSSVAPPLIKHLPSPSHSHSHSNSRRGSDESSADAEGDPDADGDVDADADADAELLEAVHAAENRSTSMKAEDADNDD
ncbi:hypothetical protein J3R83DRAFT_204 [Lanmaoa asiatica]|nr:hypothetical protein J3R83DRAFT_204 [Lanmaoa asiatica]